MFFFGLEKCLPYVNPEYISWLPVWVVPLLTFVSGAGSAWARLVPQRNITG